MNFSTLATAIDSILFLGDNLYSKYTFMSNDVKYKLRAKASSQDEICQAQTIRSNEKDYLKWLTNFSCYVEFLRDLKVGLLDMNQRFCHDVGFLLNNINAYYSKRNVKTFEQLFKEFCRSMRVVKTIFTELACKF